MKRIEKECRIASPFRARSPLLQREVIKEFMKGRIYRKKLLRERKKERRRKKKTRKTWRPLSFLSPPYPATFPIINPHKCCITPKINQTKLSTNINKSIFSFGQLNYLSKGKRRKNEEEIKERNLHRKKYGVTNKWHRDILGNPRPDTRQTLRTNDFHSRAFSRLSLRRGSSHSTETKG